MITEEVVRRAYDQLSDVLYDGVIFGRMSKEEIVSNLSKVCGFLLYIRWLVEMNGGRISV